MPCKLKDRKKSWRGQVRYQRATYKADFLTKREAVEWEAEKRKELRQAERNKTMQTGMDWLTFSNQYLDDAKQRFTDKVYREKKALCHRITAHLKKEFEIEEFSLQNVPLVEEITPTIINNFLSEVARTKSANCYNRDRKNLLAMWNWGIDILDLKSNPIAKFKKLPHTLQPQYTPPTNDILRVIAKCNREERIFLNCYLNTAARKCEIFEWTWNEDINFEKRQVRLATRKTRDGSKEYEWLPMNEELFQDLWSWWNNRPIKDTPYVFVSTSNRHYGKKFTTRRRFMRGLCKRAGVKEFGFHALRRFVASFLADTHKQSIKSIQRWLRHKNVRTTEVYVHHIGSDLQHTADLLLKKSSQEELPRTTKRVGNES